MHIVVNGWFWDQPNTGSGQYLQRLLSQPQWRGPSGEEAGHSVLHCYCTLLLPRQPLADREASQFSRSSKLPIAVFPLPQHLPRPLAKLYWEQVIVPRAARRLGADVLFVPYWAAPLWQPLPTVVTVHDLIPLLLPAYRASWLGRLYTRLVSYTARRCAAVITVSEAGKRDIIAHLRIPALRVFAVHNGPNVGQDSAATQVVQKYRLPERYFLYLGGFDVRKNLLGIVQAYRRYLDQGGDPGVYLVIAGKLPAEDTPFCPDPRRLVHDLQLTAQVRFIGWVEEADKPLLYAGAVAFLFPSTYEGFGMMLLEAMAAGTPVITANGSSE